MNSQTIDRILRLFVIVIWAIVGAVGAVLVVLMVWTFAVKKEWLCMMVMIVAMLAGLFVYILTTLEMFDAN